MFHVGSCEIVTVSDDALSWYTTRLPKTILLCAGYKILITLSHFNPQNEFNLNIWYRVLCFKSFFLSYILWILVWDLAIGIRPCYRYSVAAANMRRGLIIVMRTDRIIKHIQTAKTSEISYLQDLMYCFCNSKNIVIISDPHPSAGEFDGVVIRAYTISWHITRPHKGHTAECQI